MNNIPKQLTVYIPINFPDINQLVIGNGLKADKVRALLHQLYLSRIQQMGYTGKKSESLKDWIKKGGYVALSTRLLKRLLSDKYTEYLSFLLRNQFISTRESTTSAASYNPGISCKQYKINPDLLHTSANLLHFRKEVIHDRVTIKAILRTSAFYSSQFKFNPRNSPMNFIHQKLIDMEKQVRFDIDGAKKWISELGKDGKNITLMRERLEFVNGINEGHANNEKVCVFGHRLHTPLKRVSRSMRPFAYFDGHEDKALVCLDISNSQLFFASLISNLELIDIVVPEFAPIKPIALKYTKEEDFVQFANLCASGNIYDYWQEIRQFETREQAKKDLLKVLFCKNNSKAIGISFFRETFPSVSKCIYDIKNLTEITLPFITETYLYKNGKYKEDSFHCNLSCLAQRLESRIFIERICSKLISKGVGPFFIVHDSIFIHRPYVNLVHEVISEEFKRLNVLIPTLKETVLPLKNSI